MSDSLCWDCKSAWNCNDAVAVGMDACSAYNQRPHPPGPARPPDLNLARKLWANTPPELHPKPWTSTDAKSQELAELRAKLQTANEDLRASTEQHIMDDEIIVGLRAKLAEAEANLRANAAMLARQTDMAREAEAQAEQLEKRLDEMADLAKGYRVERDAAIEREAALREVLPPVAQLKLLAAWLDIHDDEFGSKGRDVQLDLRNWADKINAALATPSKTEGA